MEDFINTLSESQKRALLDALTKNSETTLKDIPQQVKTESIKKINEDFTINKEKSNNKRREPVRGRENRWVDEGEFRDVETPKTERVARNRPQHKKVEVECSVCGKPFRVDPKYVYGEYHRCNRCVGR
jgi:formylmethanofuran dehydrogenase subunit E